MTKRSSSPRTRDLRAQPAPTTSSTPASSPSLANYSEDLDISQCEEVTYFMSTLDGVCAYYINTEEQLRAAIGSLQRSGCHMVSLDLEGVNLSKSGRISVMHLYDGKIIYIFDVQVLGDMVFREGYLRELLCSETVTKIMFDCRKDCEALFHQFQIKLGNVIDVQMAEIVYRHKLTRCVPRYFIGLASAVEQYNIVKSDHLAGYTHVRNAALNLYCPARGGHIEVWGERPLNVDLLLYCAEDIKSIYRLYTKVFAKRLSYETCIGVSLIRLRETLAAPAESEQPVRPNTNQNVSGGATDDVMMIQPAISGKCFVTFDVALFSKFEDSMQQYKKLGLFMKNVEVGVN